MKKLDNWVVEKERILLQGHDVMKTFYNLSKWNGADLFGARNTNIIIVTERLKEIIEKAKLKNIQFDELKPHNYETLFSFYFSNFSYI